MNNTWNNVDNNSFVLPQLLSEKEILVVPLLFAFSFSFLIIIGSAHPHLIIYRRLLLLNARYIY